MVRKAFPHSYLLSPFSLLPSFFLCIFPFAFFFIPLKDLINVRDCSFLRKEKVEKEVLLLSLRFFAVTAVESRLII